MSSWLQSQFRVAEGLLEAVDRTAKQVSKKEQQEGSRANSRLLDSPSASFSGALPVLLTASGQSVARTDPLQGIASSTFQDRLTLLALLTQGPVVGSKPTVISQPGVQTKSSTEVMSNYANS